MAVKTRQRLYVEFFDCSPKRNFKVDITQGLIGPVVTFQRGAEATRVQFDGPLDLEGSTLTVDYVPDDEVTLYLQVGDERLERECPAEVLAMLDLSPEDDCDDPLTDEEVDQEDIEGFLG